MAKPAYPLWVQTGWRGWLPPPFDPPENARADARKIAGYGFAAMAVSPGSCGRWAVLPVDHIVPSSAGFAFSASVAKDLDFTIARREARTGSMTSPRRYSPR